MKEQAAFNSGKTVAVWLLVAILVSVIWSSSMAFWAVGLCSWVIVGMAWITRHKLLGKLNRLECASAYTAYILIGGCGLLAGYLVYRFSYLILNPAPQNALLFCIAVSIWLSVLATLWAIAALIPSESRGTRADPIQAIANSWRRLKSDNRFWTSAFSVAGIQVIAVLVGYSAGGIWQVIAGLTSAFAQVTMFKQAEYAKIASAIRAPVSTQGNNLHRKALIVLIVLESFVVLFYICLSYLSSYSAAPLFKYLSGFVVGGGLVAISWLFGRVKILYYLLMSVVFLACALLLGMIVSLIGMNMLD
ncbi:hypothetical protein [Cohnella luojiensis]|uniref:Uncharacterized protein n=1 Tax=Cohnella luojiensis TaxID=652876 RepID=A0A4Y8M0H1_9BACL|nr:hypothetical protein [Cohnella luojiensis]TFE28166.1 hypothetical protein E2980_08095 [Cohnella luojiensis]